MVIQTMRQLAVNLYDHDVGKRAAALAYNMLFAMFPFLIFISNLLGLLELNVDSIVMRLLPVLPRDVVELAGSYLNYVSENSSPVLLWFSLVFTVVFPLRVAHGLMDDVRSAYQLGKPKNPFRYALRQLFLTLILLIVFVLTLVLSTLGRRVLKFAEEWLPVMDSFRIPDFLYTLWHYLRFALAYLFMFGAVGTLYVFAQDERQPIRCVLPGVICASASWLILSVAFSFYVENFANYSIIYGTLGAVIVLLLWLYMTAMVLIIGAEINAANKMVREGLVNQ